ncbi:thioesterase [Micromonospora qiuiae]|uniref:Thioesterase n=1 Tax=Micromonospora qiuiae TaxID=502268 RepID=A0ABQ4JI92_9ACTN|nr:thioesterase [Micromonospora qiuiae]
MCFIQPPARQNRLHEPHYETYAALAHSLIEPMLPYLDKPFGFFGHCGGALPGVELTRQLASGGHPVPRRVFVSSQVAPHDGPYGRFLELNNNELVNELQTMIVRLGGRPTPELMEMSLQLLLQDLEANKRYLEPDVFELPCGITAIGWSEDPEIPMELMGGWKDMSKDCRSVLLHGGHFEFLGAPRTLLAEFERDLLDVSAHRTAS